MGRAAEFQKAGVRVLLVYPGGADDLAVKATEFLDANRALESATELPEPLTLLVDSDYRLTNAYGLRWDAPRETAYPSTYVVEQGGEVSFAKVAKEHGGRVKAEQVLAALAEGS